MAYVSWLCSARSLVATTTLVSASYEWCSRDPVVTFTRGIALLPQHILDIQVAVQGLGLVTDDMAALTVAIPSNVRGDVVFPIAGTPLPTVFKITTEVERVLAHVDNDAYSIQLTAFFPNTHGDLPVELKVWDPSSGLVRAPATCTGRTGKIVRATVHFDPFVVACQNFSVWAPLVIKN